MGKKNGPRSVGVVALGLATMLFTASVGEDAYATLGIGSLAFVAAVFAVGGMAGGWAAGRLAPAAPVLHRAAVGILVSLLSLIGATLTA